MAKRDTRLTEAEWAIIRAVWDHEPCAAPTVQEAISKSRRWSYSTVKTMMDRMVEKGFLTTERIRNLVVYRSAISRRQAQKSEVMATMKRAFDGAMTPMVQFLIESGDVTADELQQLEALVRDRRKQSARKK